MKKFKVFTDSTANVERPYREAMDFDYLSMVFTIENVQYDASLDWERISPEDYYSKMRAGNRPITGLVKNIEVENKFEEALKGGFDILYVACSGKLSGSVNSARIIADELLKKYPERKVICFDTLRSCYAEGMIAMEAAKLSNEGMSLEDAFNRLDSVKLNYQTYATVGTLDWLRKAGRVKASSAFFGNLLGVKPIIMADANGNNYGFKKVKGRRTSLDELVNITCERIINPEEQTIFLEHADNLRDAEYVANAIISRIHPKRVNISNLGPIIGATTGPDTILINFYGKKVELVSGE